MQLPHQISSIILMLFGLYGRPRSLRNPVIGSVTRKVQFPTRDRCVGEGNDGLVTTLRFTGEGADGKLILTELSSRRIGHSARLMVHCRDETNDRFRKTYRVERDQEPPRTVTLVCMECQLSTKGGCTCR